MKVFKLLIILSLVIISINFEICGFERATEPHDCFSYSTDQKSCCFFSTKTRKSCVLYDKLHKGEKKYGTLYVICNSNYLKISALLTFLFFII
jgi:hypothetical protein